LPDLNHISEKHYLIFPEKSKVFFI